MASLLWLDCGGGLLVGAGLLLLSRWLQPLFGLPEGLYHGVTAANLAYGCFALFVATQRPRSVRLIAVLAGANAVWGVFCLVAIALVLQREALLGCIHLAGEALFVFWLARMEWRHRKVLAGQ